MFHGNPKDAITSKVVALKRKGKILHIELSSLKGSLFLSFHLKLSGQILYAPSRYNPTFKNMIPRANSHTMPAQTTRVIFYFDDDSALYFNDMRKFGWVKLSPQKEEAKGTDVLSELFTINRFTEAISKTSRPIKVVLLDQDRIAGIGNIYANDSLWLAKIHPERKANTLTASELQALYESILKIIHEGIKYKGSSAKDELYMVPDSEKGEYQNHFKTYHMHGTPCKRCGTTIIRIEVGGRGTFFCPTCQT